MMIRLRRTRRLRYGVIPTLLVGFLAGCTKWSTIRLGPDLPERVRATYSLPPAADACLERDELYSPVVLGDSLVGQPAAGVGGVRRSIHTSDICMLERRTGDTGRTVLAVLGTAVVVFGAALAVFVASACNEEFPLFCP